VVVQRFVLQIAVGIANGVYAIIKCLPVRNKVTFITWNSNSPSLDYRILMSRLRQTPKPPKVVALCRELSGGISAQWRYGFHLLHQMYQLATSKVVVLDSYSVLASVLHHRPELRVVQIWHALGAFKKFGWSIVDKSEGWSAQSNIPSRTLARLLRMHAGYTHAAVSYSGAVPHFAEAFRCQPNILRVAWLPRVTFLRDEAAMAKLRAQILSAHPELGQGRVVLYAPTIRRSPGTGAYVDSLIESLACEDWNLVVKLHPVRGEMDEPTFPDHSVAVPDFSALELLAIADAVVTDYSAIVYEAYLCGVPVYFHAHDINDYTQACGFYTDPQQFPSKIYPTTDELIEGLRLGVYDSAAMERFVEVFVEDSDQRIDILELIDPKANPEPGLVYDPFARSPRYQLNPR
jgi:CDP-ribitol ribitolphosphotransferase